MNLLKFNPCLLEAVYLFFGKIENLLAGSQILTI